MELICEVNESFINCGAFIGILSQMAQGFAVVSGNFAETTNYVSRYIKIIIRNYAN
jgi:hypothetical protein